MKNMAILFTQVAFLPSKITTKGVTKERNTTTGGRVTNLAVAHRKVISCVYNFLIYHTWTSRRTFCYDCYIIICFDICFFLPIKQEKHQKSAFLQTERVCQWAVTQNWGHRPPFFKVFFCRKYIYLSHIFEWKHPSIFQIHS